MLCCVSGAPWHVLRTTVHEAQESMQITKKNFQSALPAVKEAIHECDFLSFDCEMTGLFLDDNAHSMLDNMPARYSKVRGSVRM